MQIGSASAASLSQMHAKIFSKIDANSDGGLTLEEMTSGAPTNKTGQKEDAASVEKRFASMDTNSDGTVSEEEGLSFFQSQMSSDTMGGMLQAQEACQDGGQGDGGTPPAPPAGGGGGAKAPQSFDELDTNQDGTVSLDEMMAASGTDESEDTSKIEELFSAMDADGDGSVTESEKSAFDEEMRANGPPPPQTQVQSTESGDASSATVSDETAAKLAALTSQWMQSMAQIIAEQTTTSTTSVAA